MISNPDISKIREIAEGYCRNKIFYCSEAVVKTIVDEFEVDIPPDVIAMSSGIPVGMGGAGCCCGAIIGGIMCLGLFFGRRYSDDPRITHAMTLSKELYSKFHDLYGASCCKVLIKDLDFSSNEQTEFCTSIVGFVAEETSKIIIRELNA